MNASHIIKPTDQRSPSRLDLNDTLYDKLAKAESLSKMLYGESGPAFRNLAAHHQDMVCLLLSDLLTEARQALDGLPAAERENAR